MNLKVLLLLCIAAGVTAGCTDGTPPAAAPSPPVSPAVTVMTTAGDTMACTADADCVPAQCCHPVGCTNQAAAAALSCEAKLCTMSCEGPIDCGAGSCGCVNGTCGIIPAAQKISVNLEVSPQRYSPILSPAPGIRLTPVVTGFEAADMDFGRNDSDFKRSAITYEWNATFGEFVMWGTDQRADRVGNPVATDLRTIYWTFTDTPESTNNPVTIMVTARDMTRRGAVLGSSTVTLNWDADYAVCVQGTM